LEQRYLGEMVASWSRCGPSSIQRALGPAHAVYDATSGETHFLSELPALLLQAIDRTPRSAIELLTAVAGEADYTPEQIQQAEAALRELERAGLVEYVEPVS
jgi:PqqD family protein of HPr-rel-A system